MSTEGRIGKIFLSAFRTIAQRLRVLLQEAPYGEGQTVAECEPKAPQR